MCGGKLVMKLPPEGCLPLIHPWGNDQADFCKPAFGNEKRDGENRAGYSRRNAFVPVITTTSYEEIDPWLWE